MSKISKVNPNLMPPQNLALRQLVNEKANGNAQEFGIGLGLSKDSIGRLLRPDRYTGEFNPISANVKELVIQKYKLPSNWFEETALALEKRRESGEVEIPFIPSPNTTRSDAAKDGSVFGFDAPQNIVRQLPQYDYTFTLSGNLMLPSYRPGDILAVRDIESSAYRQWGKPHVLNTKQGLVIGRLYPYNSDGADDTYRCVPENKIYPEVIIPKSEISGIFLVVGFIRRE